MVELLPTFTYLTLAFGSPSRLLLQEQSNARGFPSGKACARHYTQGSATLRPGRNNSAPSVAAKAIRTHVSLYSFYMSESAKFSLLYLILPYPSIIYIILYPLYSLWDPLVTLSKYIRVWSSFEEFIETNLMVQSKFNLDFWFVSYNTFFLGLASGACHCAL
jgi:hypothetical protein